MCKADDAPRSSRADFSVGGKRAFACLPVIDDRLRIALAELDARTRQFERRRTPGLVDGATGQAGELRHPALDIGSAWIELLALQDRIEDPEIGRGVGAAAGH